MSAELVDVDPAVHSPTPEQLDRDFEEHTGTYNGFVHITMWFALHVPLLLAGLYLMTLGGSMWGGLVVLAAGIGVLGYGLATTASRRRK